MFITIKDYSSEKDISFRVDIDNTDIKRFLVEALEDVYIGPDYVDLPDYLLVDPYNTNESYTIEEYADEYMYELMEIEWYYDYVYDRIIEEFGKELWEAFHDSRYY